MTKKDQLFGIVAGLLIGLLALPVLRAAKPALYAKHSLLIFLFFLVGTPVGLWIASLIARKARVVWQIAKFGVIGVLNTLVDLGVLALLLFILTHYYGIASTARLFAIGATIVTVYAVCKSISFVVAVANSYYWNKYWTFESGAAQKTRSQFIQFFVVSIIGFVINVVTASYVFQSIHPIGGMSAEQWALMGAATGSIAGLAWNFIGYKFIVFKNK